MITAVGIGGMTLPARGESHLGRQITC